MICLCYDLILGYDNGEQDEVWKGASGGWEECEWVRGSGKAWMAEMESVDD